MKGFTAILLSMLVLSAQCNWADQVPYCLEPAKYPVTMETTSATVDVLRYMGTWYEIARMPDKNQKGCTCSKAEYNFNPEEKFVEVHNSCIKDGGEVIDIRGKAIPQNEANSKLNVYFNPAFPGPYWILDIDVDYQWVVVGEPCKKYGWILSRTTSISESLLQSKIALLRYKGFNVDELEYRPSTC